VSILVFEHGLTHGPVGDPPYVRLTIETTGRITLEDVDEQEELTFRGEAKLAPLELAPILELVDPEKMRMLGRSVGTGHAWARMVHGQGKNRYITMLFHSSPPGVLDASQLQGVAKAARPILGALLSLFGIVKGGIEETTRRHRTLVTKPEPPIRVEAAHGTLLMRYHEGTGSGRWLKVFDSGVVEHREYASPEGDGKPGDGKLVTLSTGRVAELFELVRRHLPRVAALPKTATSIWELYQKNGKRDVRGLFEPEQIRLQNPPKAQLSAIREAQLAFSSMYHR
jgi:hypothetical protein